ncbi:MAG: ABC transporter permease [Pirellulaceae bacterium]|jgi:peptide/nickel transport system permease protein|nr:ABC transporter permease [Pirellulaceae bacterium]MDP7020618.1 ABC transporter permease [Pirellulaceae bacterium]
MVSYLIRRSLLGLLTLWFVTMLIYGMIRSMPGDPLLIQQAETSPEDAASQEEIARWRAAAGLDKPWYSAYASWLGNALQLDFGLSLTRHRPVATIIGERVGPTLLMTCTSLVITYVLAIPLGLYFTVRSSRWDERIGSVVLYMLYSMPTYVAALLLQILFAVYLGDTVFGLPLYGVVSSDYESMTTWGKTVDVFSHSLLPVTCYTYGSLAYYSRFIRANMQEVIRQDYIRTARAKGLGPVRVVVVHAFRNTLIPLVTMIGLTLPFLLSGAIIIEQIFSWPGIGKLFLDAISERDYPTIMALTLMFSVMTMIGQLLADVLYAFVDPRITYN